MMVDFEAQVRQMAAATRNVIPMTLERQALEEALDPIVRQLMYYNP